jgi:hypothetical protein
LISDINDFRTTEGILDFTAGQWLVVGKTPFTAEFAEKGEEHSPQRTQRAQRKPGGLKLRAESQTTP